VVIFCDDYMIIETTAKKFQTNGAAVKTRPKINADYQFKKILILKKYFLNTFFISLLFYNTIILLFKILMYVNAEHNAVWILHYYCMLKLINYGKKFQTVRYDWKLQTICILLSSNLSFIPCQSAL